MITFTISSFSGDYQVIVGFGVMRPECIIEQRKDFVCHHHNGNGSMTGQLTLRWKEAQTQKAGSMLSIFRGLFI